MTLHDRMLLLARGQLAHHPREHPAREELAGYITRAQRLYGQAVGWPIVRWKLAEVNGVKR